MCCVQSDMNEFYIKADPMKCAHTDADCALLKMDQIFIGLISKVEEMQKFN